ncbi:hypothetical protein [Niallia taxi]|uniref:hypothetical protein n=1 Tax=Niallia taxi TaxID=2499688 RepID=UPI002E1FFDC4|nr:hypothetical protein [Niallia taxi]
MSYKTPVHVKLVSTFTRQAVHCTGLFNIYLTGLHVTVPRGIVTGPINSPFNMVPKAADGNKRM